MKIRTVEKKRDCIIIKIFWVGGGLFNAKTLKFLIHFDIMHFFFVC